MRIIETKVYTIDEHPNKEKCYEWIRNNWHDLNEHSVNEVVDSIESLSKIIGGTVTYSIGAVPDRSQHIIFKNYDKQKLYSLSADTCPLTGVCWDIDVIEGLKYGNLNSVLDSLHCDTEYIYSDNGLHQLCIANEYEFTEYGQFVN